jgi:hypothetical protein
MARAGTRHPVRTSDLVRLEQFWETPTFEAMHGFVPDARYPVAISLHATTSASVFLALHRARRDFGDEDLALLTILQGIVAPAISHRLTMEAALLRLEVLGVVSADQYSILTRREKEALVFAAQGLTNGPSVEGWASRNEPCGHIYPPCTGR